ncbi:MAG: methylated-DNA--[protein]-cysteine S-methyltransferase [Methylococcaceae bacterium]
MNLYFQQTLLGKIGIAENEGKISDVYFETDNISSTIQINQSVLIKEAFDQLNAYLLGTLTEFTLPLSPQGSVFQQSVWQSLCEIPYGKTVSYKEIALMINKPKAAQAVGQANSKNPIPIFIPCHRVIGMNGKLVGYSGGLAIKKQLLALENKRTLL